jgi:hypothetical protein
VWDPRLFNFRASFTPTFRRSSASQSVGSTLGRDLAMDFGATLIGSTRLPVDVSYIRNSANTENSYGGRSEYAGTVLGVSASFLSRYFPANLRYRRVKSDRLWLGGASAVPTALSEDIGEWRFNAGNRKLRLFWNRTDYQEAVRAENYLENGWGVNHLLEWGKGSMLQSRFEDMDREGFGGFGRRSWTEDLRIQHSNRVSSQFRMARFQVKTDWGATKIRTIGGALKTQPTDWLSTNLNATRSRYERPEGASNDRTTLRPQVVLRLGLPHDIHFISDVSLTLEDLEIDGVGGDVLDVVGEEHVVDKGRVFRLDNRLAIPSTVMVYDASRTILYEEGADYQVDQIAGWVELRAQPTGRIQEDETLLIDYQYRLEVPESSRSTWLAYSVGLSWTGIALSHGRSIQEVNPLDGTLQSPLDFRDEQWVRLSVSRQTLLGGVSLNAGYRQRKELDHPFSSKEMQLQWSPPPLGSIQFLLFQSLARTTNGSPGNGRRSRTTSASLTWPILRSLTLRSGVDTWRWSREDGTNPEEFFGGWGNLAWRIGNTEADLRVIKNVRWAGATDIERGQTRWSLRLVRRF